MMTKWINPSVQVSHSYGFFKKVYLLKMEGNAIPRAVHAKLFSGVWLCDPMDCSLPGSSVHGVLQIRILKWVAISSSKGSFWPRDWIWIFCLSCNGRQILYHRATLQALSLEILKVKFAKVWKTKCRKFPWICCQGKGLKQGPHNILSSLLLG